MSSSSNNAQPPPADSQPSADHVLGSGMRDLEQRLLRLEETLSEDKRKFDCLVNKSDNLWHATKDALQDEDSSCEQLMTAETAVGYSLARLEHSQTPDSVDGGRQNRLFSAISSLFWSHKEAEESEAKPIHSTLQKKLEEARKAVSNALAVPDQAPITFAMSPPQPAPELEPFGRLYESLGQLWLARAEHDFALAKARKLFDDIESAENELRDVVENINLVEKKVRAIRGSILRERRSAVKSQKALLEEPKKVVASKHVQLDARGPGGTSIDEVSVSHEPDEEL